MSTPRHTQPAPAGRPWTRRRFLQALTAGAGASLLAACGQPTTPAATTAPAATKAAAATTAPTTAAATPAMAATPAAAAASPAATAQPAAGPPKRGGTLVYAVAAEAERLDPGRATDDTGLAVLNNVTDGLVNFGRGELKLEPGLATRWEISPDSKTYTFTLREGVKFHDGTPFNAEAVKFNYDRIIDSNSRYHHEQMAYHQESLLGQVERVEAPNPTTLRLVLKQPFGPLLNVLGTSMMKIISPKSIQDDMEGAVVNPVGTGPFKFVRWDRRASLEMVRNDDFWGEKAYLDRIIWKYVPESSVRLSEVETGASQLFDTVGVRDADRVRNNRQLQMLTNVFPSWLYAWFNLRMPPLENVKVRQAMCYAINYEGIVNNLYNGIGALPDAGPLGPGLVGYQKGLNPYKYDPARARTLLQESGVTTPFNISMLSSNYTRAYCPVGMDRVAQAIQADFGQVGIQVNLQILDASPYRAAIADPATRPHFFIGGWVNDYPDQDQFIFANGESTQSFNRGFWSNPQFDQAVREAQVITDEARRAQLYQQAAKIYFDEAPQVVFNYGLLNSVARSNVRNLKLTSHTAWKFDQVWME